jgi:hypothetical protein
MSERRKYGGIWRSRYNHEIYKLYNEPDIVKVIKVGRLRCLGQHFRMRKQYPCSKLTLHKPEGTRRADRSAVRWLDSVEDGLKTMALETGDESHRIETNGQQS